MTQQVVLDARWGPGGGVQPEDVEDAINCLRAIINSPRHVRGTGYKLAAVRLMLEQWRWEQSRGRDTKPVDSYENMSNAELVEKSREAEAELRLLEQETTT